MSIVYIRKLPFLALIVFLAMSRPAFGLATEHFGNDPIRPNFINLGSAEVALANLKTRFYWREVNGDPMFYYRGDTEALNEALRLFAALPAKKKEVRFLPGAGVVSSLGGDKRMDCDWFVHTPSGFSYAHEYQRKGVPYPDATLTIYVPTARRDPADAKAVEQLIAELESEAFATRDNASKALEKLGVSASKQLRDALTRSPAPETKRRLGLLIDLLPRVDLNGVVLPRDVPAVGIEGQAAFYESGLKHTDGTVRGLCVGGLGRLAEYDDRYCQRLVEILDKDSHEYVRRYAASMLSQMGRRAEKALPTLRAGLKDPMSSVRDAFEHALKSIENSKPEEGRAEKLKATQEIVKDISRFLVERQVTSQK